MQLEIQEEEKNIVKDVSLAQSAKKELDNL